MQRGSDHHVAHGVIGLLIVAIGFVLFYKLAVYEQYFSNDIEALRNYVILSILTMGFLTGLFFLSSKPNKSKVMKATKTKSSKKKKK
jgi:hypothetical protein